MYLPYFSSIFYNNVCNYYKKPYLCNRFHAYTHTHEQNEQKKTAMAEYNISFEDSMNICCHIPLYFQKLDNIFFHYYD